MYIAAVESKRVEIRRRVPPSKYVARCPVGVDEKPGAI
jgi:hypothetical protein